MNYEAMWESLWAGMEYLEERRSAPLDPVVVLELMSHIRDTEESRANYAEMVLLVKSGRVETVREIEPERP
jgi:hypothetical protein